MSKGRAAKPRAPYRRRATQVHKDTRTARVRTRGQVKRTAVREQEEVSLDPVYTPEAQFDADHRVFD